METQADRILHALKAGAKLTQADATRYWGCTRLAARVWDLRAQGVKVEDRMVEVPTRYGTARVAEYWLPRDGELF